jgi:hypothetical protein
MNFYVGTFQYEEIPGTLEHINELMVEKEVSETTLRPWFGI